MRAAVFVWLTACHAGVGPVVAYSTRGDIRVGGEASGGMAFLRGSTGITFSPAGTSPQRFYIAAEPGLGGPVRGGGLSSNLVASGGLTLGFASTDQHDLGGAIGFWGAASYIASCSDDNAWSASIAIGLRWLSSIGEIYATPKVGFVSGCDVSSFGH